jgi:hypothetical protein
MWAGNAPWILPARLDIGGDDYFSHGQNCLDAHKSIFMVPPTPDATPPPGWGTEAVSSAVSQEVELCVLAPGPKVIRVRRQ